MKPYLRAANVTWDGLGLADVKSMHFSQSEVQTFRLQRGDILLAEASGSADQVGKPAIWQDEIADCCFQNTLLRVRTDHMDRRFLLWFFKWLAFSGQFANSSRGVGIHHLGAHALSEWPTPIPPLPEQRRIVAAAEEEFSRIDAGVAALTTARARIQSFRKVLLLSAVPEVPPASWKITTVGEAGAVTLGRQRSPKVHRGANMRPYLRVANVFEDRIDTASVMTMNFSEEEFSQYRLEPNDILLNEGQSPHLLGRPAMYRGVPPDVAFTNTLLRFRPRSGVLPDWALLVFRRHLHAKRFMRESQITTNIAHLSAGRFKAIEFPIPPLDDQRRISAEFALQNSLVSTVALAVSQELTRSTALRASVLAAAFSGKLVPQDPKDEPVSALLERAAVLRGDSTGSKSRQIGGFRAKVTA
jgi:type I restriction enzyme S subunit